MDDWSRFLIILSLFPNDPSSLFPLFFFLFSFFFFFFLSLLISRLIYFFSLFHFNDIIDFYVFSSPSSWSYLAHSRITRFSNKSRIKWKSAAGCLYVYCTIEQWKNACDLILQNLLITIPMDVRGYDNIRLFLI